MAKVEEKLFQNRYRVDADRPHIRIKEDVFYKNPSLAQDCATCCPAGCWTLEDDGKAGLMTDGCLKCGTCRVLCGDAIEWEYPRGGYGILFKFG